MEPIIQKKKVGRPKGRKNTPKIAPKKPMATEEERKLNEKYKGFDFTQLLKKKEPEVPKWTKEPPVRPDKKIIITRPKAEYTQSRSPYGISDELHEKALR